MRRTKILFTLVALVLQAAITTASFARQNTARSPTTWTPELQVKVKTFGAARVSPDGRRVAYTLSNEVMTPDKSEYVTQIHLANADGSNSVQITFGEKSSTNPKWSPDGASLAFTSNRKDNKNNLYLLRLSGGEAEPLTDLKSNIADFEWSPDGRWVAFTMTDQKTEDEERADKGRNDFRYVDENIKMNRLYVLSVQKDANGKRDPRKLTVENYNVSTFDWSPDGARLVFSHAKTPSANDWTTLDVSLVEVASGKVTSLAATPAAEGEPTFSPDGKSVAMVVSDIPARWARTGLINVVSAMGGAPKALAPSFDGQPDIAGWSADGRRIYFTEAKGTGTRIYTLDVAANRITEVEGTNAVLSNVNLNRSGSMLGFVMQTPERAPEVYVSSINNFAPIQISRANADLPKLPLGRTEVIRWKSTDGKEIEGLLTYPVGYQAGTKVPLILNIHGGPAGVFAQTFIGGRGVYPIATFAARGYAILRPNPRGSSGYGTEFRRANLNDWGGADYQDLMTGVDKVIEMGVADKERLGVMGWSYGGYMTSWIVTQTKRFKAASAGAPVTNLMSFNGTADIPSFVPDYFGGHAWEHPEIYQKHSAMFNVKGVSTPTLIQHGDADVRVPISQGYEFYNALKQQNVPTRMLVLPRQPHGPNEPKMQIAAMQSNLDWFEKYLGNANAAAQR
ncbi:MAG: S9 family peptidase [Pyrinomonadaceae bacterium]|nr:S9 family peptidase [Pyrinomonadaceae bacterium]